MGYVRSPLSYPASGESRTGTGDRTCTQKFLGGTIRWNTCQGTSVAPCAGTIAAVVNKRRPNVPINQVPPDLVGVGSQLMRREAAAALSRFISAGAAAGVPITSVSGYSSYSTQCSLYRSYVASYGPAYADTISARPGFSEHQLGLAMEIGNPSGACGLQACFANTSAGAYPADMHNRGFHTLEQYFGMPAAPGY